MMTIFILPRFLQRSEVTAILSLTVAMPQHYSVQAAKAMENNVKHGIPEGAGQESYK